MFPVGLTGRWSGLTFSPCPAPLPSPPLLRGWSHDTSQQASRLHTLQGLLSWGPTRGPHPGASSSPRYTTTQPLVWPWFPTLGFSQVLLNSLSGAISWALGAVTGQLAQKTASLTTSTGMNSARECRLGSGTWLHVIFPSLFCPQRGASLSGIWERQ